MKVSIIIANYNGEELLKKNLPRVIEAADYYQTLKKEKVEIIIVDDASTDKSVEFIKKQKHIALIEIKRNLGFSSAINRGVRAANGELVMLLNTDVYPQREFIAPLVGNFKDESVFAVGCMDKSVEENSIIMRGRGLAQWSRGFLVHKRGDVDRKDTFWVSGGSGMFRKSIWEKLGGFSEVYNPFYWEDIDISYRAVKCGYRLVFEPESIVVHEHETGAIKSSRSSFAINTIAYRNQFIFIWKNITDRSFTAFHISWLPYYVLKAFFCFDLAFIIGFLRALILLPIILKLRYRESRIFVLSDKEAISKI